LCLAEELQETISQVVEDVMLAEEWLVGQAF
jgi:hypothetical protein